MGGWELTCVSVKRHSRNSSLYQGISRKTEDIKDQVVPRLMYKVSIYLLRVSYETRKEIEQRDL